MLHSLFTIVGMGLAAVHLVCWIVLLIDAFTNSVWKGLVGLFCCELYLMYYAFAEYRSENKLMVLLGYFGGMFLGGALLEAAGVNWPW